MNSQIPALFVGKNIQNCNVIFIYISVDSFSVETLQHIIVAVGLKSQQFRVRRICIIASTIAIDILFRNLSFTILIIEKARLTEAFENGKLNRASTSLEIFSNRFVPPASLMSYTSTQRLSVLVHAPAGMVSRYVCVDGRRHTHTREART